MGELVAYPTGDGDDVVVVEMEATELVGTERAAVRPGEIAARASESFDEAVDRIRPAAASLVAKLRDMPQQPSEVTVEFGVKLAVKAGAVIASTGGEGHFRVSLTWRKDQQPGG